MFSELRMPVLNRRTMLRAAMALTAGGLIATPAMSLAASTTAPDTKSAKGAKLVLLGTKGGPRVGGKRSNPANALVVDNNVYVIDTGMGVTSQFVKAGLNLSDIRAIFISHMHSDHELEFGNLVYNMWAAGVLRRPVDAYGPAGMEALAADYWHLNREDIRIRMADEGKAHPDTLLRAHDFRQSQGTVMSADGVTVTAFTTPHPPMENLAYRFETPYGSVVYSGDTAYNPALADFAKGADVLVHEVLYVPGVDALVKRANGTPEFRNHLLESHTSAEQVGMIAKRAGVKKLVLSHFVPGDMEWITDDMWRDEVAKHYKGEIVVGRDLMEIPLG
ncbi:MBL fold metallo-hydrolase [Novosphingobium sp. KN65.2]|uniref:MBL fold metallo-hydrolase n=1 Tax=Novosphingobium sp. KN65.2 TaxID=1478134 RepID=UPI0005DE5FC7|nr:MBL fold metallo-hydrolase [Novosphingobium sp. KN65.2]CDO35210.1 putative hydrolase; putative Metal-dependent hydrolase of the beta-lactamase superfamily III [Novosphingobium sp. KN65.2]